MPHVATGPHQASVNHVASSQGLGRAPPLQGAGRGSEHTPGAECALCPRGTERGCRAWALPPDSGPIVQTPVPAAVPGLGGFGRRRSNAVAAARAPGMSRGGLAQCQVSGGPDSVLGWAGWSGPRGPSCRGQRRDPPPGPASLPGPLLQLCPRYLRHLAAAGLHSPHHPSVFLTPGRAWQAAGRAGDRK